MNIGETLSPGETEIKLTVHRYQSEYSTDGWGSPIENPLNETLFLIKKQTDEEQHQTFNPEVIVLYKGEVKEYYINLVQGKKGEEKGFLVLVDFENDLYGKKHEVGFFDNFNRRLLSSFWFGISRLKNYVEIKIKENKKSRKKNKKWYD